MSDDATEIGACDGCGSTKTLEELRAAGHLSCCPERKMLSASEWKARADNAADEITRLRDERDAAITAERKRCERIVDRYKNCLPDVIPQIVEEIRSGE